MFARIAALLTVIVGVAVHARAADEEPMTKGPYTYGPDSQIQPGVPRGQMDKWIHNSTIFTGTTRDVWVYVPAQYKASEPACLMIFQDGPRQYAVRENEVNSAARQTAEYRTPNVLDNLIHKKELPVMIAVFINPGSRDIAANGQPDFENRSFEYDTVSDKYSQFLFSEILPQVEKKYSIRKDPAGRGIGGISSGAICAFTVAWNHPEQFSKVLSDIGSYTNIRGGHVYPKLVMDAPKKPIRIAMQDGTNDNRRPETPERDWYLQNRLMRDAFKAKGYDIIYVLGDGPHDSKHGGAIMPDQMRWLWRDQAPGAKAGGN